MKKTEHLFDSMARGITSLGAVIIVMFATISGMVFFSHTLFESVFPETMESWEKLVATWLMAIGWEATVLITTVNVKHVNRNVPGTLAVCSGIIVLFFIEAFDFSQSAMVIFERAFVGVLAATINYIYSDMFYAKWVERIAVIEQPMKLNELHSTINQLQSELDEARPKLNQFKDLLQFKKRIETELTCPHCQRMHSTFGALHAHKGHCLSNPKKKQSTSAAV